MRRQEGAKIMRNIIAAAALVAALSGCGVIEHVNARSEMVKSKEAYKACLAENGEMLSRCEGKRLAYEADMRAYGLTPLPASAPPPDLSSTNLTCTNTGMVTNCHTW